METTAAAVGSRLRVLRKGAGLTQTEIGKMLGVGQGSINRYETGNAEAPYRVLVWYAQYFNVSMDYLFALCEDKHGRFASTDTAAQGGESSAKPDWSEFVEACFESGSELNQRLKQMILNMNK